ncbi:MAG: regulator of protease activity HflC (stomatin/prohibitin superfamily) [Glaciecola sp.]|jgi:regulator of protease activity HflC (stomatin/prohibitin superfamily)
MKKSIGKTVKIMLAMIIAVGTLTLTSCDKKKVEVAKVSKDFVHNSTLQKVRLGDGIPLSINMSVRWKIEDMVSFKKQFTSADAFDSLVLAPRKLELANNVSNTYASVDTMFNSQRLKFITDLKAYLKSNLGEEGIAIKEVIISDIIFPRTFLNSKEKLALQEQELETIRKQSIINVARAEADKKQTKANGLVAMTRAEVDAKVQRIKADTEKSRRASKLAKAETEKQVAKLRAQSDATRKKLLAKASLESKTDLRDLELGRKKQEAQLEFNNDMRMAKLCSDNPVYATYMVNKELASKVQIAVLPSNQDASVFSNLLGKTAGK